MTRMPWGKHRGTPIDQIESSYLIWALENADLPPSLAQAIAAELRSRFGSPPPPSSPPSWRSPCPDPVLATAVITAGLHVLARRHHPDVGGDVRTMQQLNAVAEWLKRTVPQ